MIKLLGIIAPFIMGRFMGPQAPQGPGIIEKSVLAYRKILALTLIGLVSAFTFSAGLILGAIAIGQQIDLTGNWQWTNLSLAGVWLVGIGVVGFIATLAVGKFWRPHGLVAHHSPFFGKEKVAHGNPHVSLAEALGLFLMDVIEERRTKRLNKNFYSEPARRYSNRNDTVENYQNPLH